MSKPVVVECGIFVARGATKTDATARLNAVLEKAVSGSYVPVIVRYRGALGIAIRTPEGWWCRIFEQDDPDEFKLTHPVDGTRENVARKLRYYVAQRMWQFPETSSDVVLDATDQDEFQGWATWQCTYKRLYDWAVARGKTDEGAKDFAWKCLDPHVKRSEEHRQAQSELGL